MNPYLYHRNSKNYSKRKVINETNIKDDLADVLWIHNQNRREIDYLYNYVAGDQPIQYRTKEYRPDIKNNIVENHAFEITRFIIAQNFGEPIKYVLDSTETDNAKSKAIDQLNKMMEVRNKSYFDVQIGDWQSSCGTAYRESWSVKREDADEGEPLFDIDFPDPRYNFVVHSKERGHKALYSVSIGTDDKGNEIQYCTTNSQVLEVKGDKVGISINGHGKILLTEYPNNQGGYIQIKRFYAQ